MAKVIKVETGIAREPAAGCTPKTARFTFEDGSVTFMSVDAFPSVAIMVEDAVDEQSWPHALLSASRGSINEQNSGAYSVPEWTTVYAA